MRRIAIALLAVSLAALLPVAHAQTPEAAEVPAAENPYAPDVPEPGSVEAIQQFTTDPKFLPRSVAYVPESETVPSPTEVLGHLVGAPDELSRTADIYGYFRRLDEASDRVQLKTIGTTEEGREILLAMISDTANLADIDRYKQITARLADPRGTTREEARQLANEGKAFYYLTGGLHSTETGSPEMLMELAYRLAVSEQPEIQAIRANAIVLITPVAEPDGRDRVVDWYYRHTRDKKLPFEVLSAIVSPPYWGAHAFHDNNRDGMQLTLALTRAIHAAYYDFHSQVVHDLHESIPLLYVSTGHGPYNSAVDPVTISEWTQIGFHEVGGLQAQGLPGVWAWAFWDGWWPGYLFSVANNHHSIGRFYETFGNSMAGTFERDLSDSTFVGKPVSEAQWYRTWPPDKKLTWSLRNNTNYMQAGVLEGLEYVARHRTELLENFWIKGDRALRKGQTEAPYAWIFPPEQRDTARLALLVNQLRAQKIEVHRLASELALGAGSARKRYPAGSYVVRMDQPYRGAALTYLEEQRFPADEPNPPYDDVAWTWPLLYGVAGDRIEDKAVLAARMEPVIEAAAAAGRADGAGEIFLLRDTGQTALLEARVLLAQHQVDAAETSFQAGGITYPAGSWIVQAPADAVGDIASRLGLAFTAAAAIPDVRRHVVDLPRIGLMHTWTATQNAGWVRYTFDRGQIPYTLISDDDLRRGNLGERFDVILFPSMSGDLAAIVHGIDPKLGPLPYTTTPEFPTHGIPDATDDMTGGMGFAGLANLQRFVEGGGVFITLGGSGTLPVQGGLVRDVDVVPPAGFNSPGSELRARVMRPEHPIAYGYEELTSVFRGNGPLWDVEDRDRGRVVLQFGTKEPEPAVAPASDTGEQEGEMEVEEVEDSSALAAPAPVAKAEEPKKDRFTAEQKRLVLSGFVRGEDVVDGKPAILDIPVGKGRVVLFAFNPLHRFLNHSDFRLVYNALLNWNDLPQ